MLLRVPEKYHIVCQSTKPVMIFIHVKNETENGLGSEGTGGYNVMWSTRMQKVVKKMEPV